MAWEQLAINKPHLVYIILGGFTSIFMLVSLFIKEKLYIGEATVATICGIIFGPHAANLIDPFTWGNRDQITLEFSRIVLVVQCFAVGVELPKSYMEKHWKSVVFLLLPVMTFGWLVTSVFIWWMIVPLTWLESLACAACVTATDPVLASSVVGKGKFAKRVPKHLRDVLSAESGCNDGMAFPFIYLSIYLLRYDLGAREVVFHWTCYTILYECIFGGFYGFMVGYIARHAIKLADRKGVIDRESFLVFYFVLALFCAGSGSMLGMDDLLIGFSAGVGFSNDGWFTEKTEESHVSNVIDLLLNLAYFVYFGTIIPWESYNTPELGITPWRLVVIALFVVFFRRIPIMMALKPIIPDIKTWREALFAGHFGPIGVGAIFAAILARAELETHSTEPLADLPSSGTKDYELIYLIWPVTTFLVVTSIVVHGSSIAVFTLGKHINTLTLTLSYTQGNETGPGWMNRLPRISSQSKSMSKLDSSSFDSNEKGAFPLGFLPPIGAPGVFLRRQKEEEYSRSGSRSSSIRASRRRRKHHDSGMGAGGPISQSAVEPQRRSEPNLLQQESGSDTLNEKSGDHSPHSRQQSYSQPQHDSTSRSSSAERKGRKRRYEGESPSERTAEVEAYQEGDDLIIEDEEGNVLETVKTDGKTDEEKAREIDRVRKKLFNETSGEHATHKAVPHAKNEGEEIEEEIEKALGNPDRSFRKYLSSWKGFGKRNDGDEQQERRPQRKRGAAHAYQFGNTIIVEDEDGEVIKEFKLESEDGGERRNTYGTAEMRRGMQRMGTWVGLGRPGAAESSATAIADPVPKHSDEGSSQAEGRGSLDLKTSKIAEKMESDDGLRVTISRTDRYGLTGLRKKADSDDNEALQFRGGRRMSAADFLRQMQQLDPKIRTEAVQRSSVSEDIKREAKRTGYVETSVGKPKKGRSATTPWQEEPISPGTVRAIPSNPPDAARGAETPGGFSRQVAESEPSDYFGLIAKRPEVMRATTGDTLESIGSSDYEVPTHDIGSSVARYGRGATAADSRRRRLATIASNEDENNDNEHAETAAEKRRRLAALGVGGDDDSSSDEDINAPRRPREQLPVQEPEPKPRVQWGGESGRDRAHEHDSNLKGTLRGMFKR